jgi:NAD(P)-dependent dehydrogenase (short-subunit alcohol dehydrogenase family)
LIVSRVKREGLIIGERGRRGKLHRCSPEAQGRRAGAAAVRRGSSAIIELCLAATRPARMRVDALRPSAMNLPLSGPESTTDLSGRAVLITGAAGGLGRALALACAARGATVVLHGRVVRKLEALYDDIVAAGHPEPTILPLDFATVTADEAGQAAGALRAQLGRLDGLVHTAALLGSLGPLEHQSFDVWQAVLRVNVAAPMLLTRALLPLLADAADAAVLFTLDTRACDPRAYWGAYGASKAALAAFAATFADETEGRANLRFNAVIPGPMRSPLRTLTHPGEDKQALPLPAALAPLYLWLLGAQAKGDSGRVFDGGAWLAGRPADLPLVATAAGSSARP